MTLRLILMRHAKSSWGDPYLSDHERPLNERGRRSAKALGDWIRKNGLQPDEVLCSTSRRTQETFELLDLPQDVHLLPTLYHASANEMLNIARGAKGNCVLMLGHNPGIGEFAARMVASRPVHPRFFDYPTGATLVVDFPIEDWSDLQPATGSPVDFVIPRSLPGETE